MSESVEAREDDRNGFRTKSGKAESPKSGSKTASAFIEILTVVIILAFLGCMGDKVALYDPAGVENESDDV